MLSIWLIWPCSFKSPEGNSMLQTLNCMHYTTQRSKTHTLQALKDVGVMSATYNLPRLKDVAGGRIFPEPPLLTISLKKIGCQLPIYPFIFWMILTRVEGYPSYLRAVGASTIIYCSSLTQNMFIYTIQKLKQRAQLIYLNSERRRWMEHWAGLRHLTARCGEQVLFQDPVPITNWNLLKKIVSWYHCP